MLVKPFSFFTKTQKIPSSETFFSNLENYRLKYYYFQIDTTYYLFLFGQTDPYEVLDLCYQSLPIIEELNTKKRKLRSLRGFILYALEILETAGERNIRVLETNLPPFFWKRIKEVIRQNQKGVLNDFLFGTSISSIQASSLLNDEVVEKLQTEVQRLNNRLETEFKTFKYELETIKSWLVVIDCQITKNQELEPNRTQFDRGYSGREKDQFQKI